MAARPRLQVFIYAVTNWNTPHILDMRGGATLLMQAENHFLTLDPAQGIQVSSRGAGTSGAPGARSTRAA